MTQFEGHGMHVPNAGAGRRRLVDEDGVTLVEVLVAMFLLTGAMLAMAHVATSGLVSLRDATDRTTAIALATEVLEQSRQVPWDVLLLDATDHAPVCGDMIAIDDAGSVTEPAVCDAAGAVGAAAPYWGANGKYDLETYVTSIPNFPNARRVTTVVSWDQGTGPRTVRSSTVIAQVDRG
jgi:hypothetical protein